MLFSSTRNKKEIATYQQAIFKGLAHDGGLYHQIDCPDLSAVFNNIDSSNSFNEIASQITFGLLNQELTQSQAENIVNNAFDFIPKFNNIEENIDIMELYHVPSAAFKDFGASFLASSMEEFLTDSDNKAVILTATSGDTGSAVAKAFHNKKNIDVVILYPSGRVSPLQEKQLTTLGGNIHALEVKGSFDDCQRMVKEAFTDEELKAKLNLTSANSISLGRLIPQSFYYIWAWAQQKASPSSRVDDLVFCVPSGNFGNITAGILANKWGMSVDHYVAATNKNDMVPKYLTSGTYEPKASIHTISNAMDVGAPSNFERMLAIYNNDVAAMRKDITGFSITDEETVETMQKALKEKDMFLCPHTAVGYLAAQRYKANNPGKKIISLSTAHPAKFLEVVEEATGKLPELPESLVKIANLEKKAELVENTLSDLKEFLFSNF